MQNAFDDVVAVTGVLFAVFYILTALATVVYYRRRVASSAWDAFSLGALPAAAAGFLGWIVVKSLQAAPAAQIDQVSVLSPRCSQAPSPRQVDSPARSGACSDLAELIIRAEPAAATGRQRS